MKVDDQDICYAENRTAEASTPGWLNYPSRTLHRPPGLDSSGCGTTPQLGYSHASPRDLAGNSMDDLDDMVMDNAAFRKKKDEEYGIGFELASALSFIPNVPKKQPDLKSKNAA